APTGSELGKLVGNRAVTGCAFGKTSGKPRATLVCLHGIQTHADWFSLLGQALAHDDYLLLCPDRAGSGRQAPPDLTGRLPKNRNGDCWTEDLAPVMREAQRRGAPVYLLGTSWGAKVAVDAMGRRGQLYPKTEFSGLILLVP